jgi:hypothetical protein
LESFKEVASSNKVAFRSGLWRALEIDRHETTIISSKRTITYNNDDGFEGYSYFKRVICCPAL